ncbi:MAG: hypothetical protein ABUS79_05790 [Pseudomonadota bacterium]
MPFLPIVPPDLTSADPVAPRRVSRIVAAAWAAAILLVIVAVCGLAWWDANLETRRIRALPDGVRLPLYQLTVRNLRGVCDPAASRSLRDFCHEQAALALRFRECETDASCQELARRHLPRPYR